MKVGQRRLDCVTWRLDVPFQLPPKQSSCRRVIPFWVAILWQMFADHLKQCPLTVPEHFIRAGRSGDHKNTLGLLGGI